MANFIAFIPLLASLETLQMQRSNCFILCSTGSKEAQDLHTQGPGKKHRSYQGAQ